nr:hypothetical protein [Tanacetum cinerariifolium]
MMMLILRGRIVQRRKRRLSMEILCLENRHLAKIMKVNQVHQCQVIKNNLMTDFWTNSYTTDDDELPTKKVSQELMDEVLQTVHEAKLRKIVDETLRQQCTSGDEHQYDIDQMKRFLKNDTKNPHAKIFYIKKQQEPEKPKEEVYSNLKIIQIIKTYWELGHEHKFITEIVTRRANGSIVSIIESDYKNLNKNDIEDTYLLIINHMVEDYAETRFCGYYQSS